MRGYPIRWIVYDCETAEHKVPGFPGVKDLRFRLGCAIYSEAMIGGVGYRVSWDFNDEEEFHRYITILKRSDEPIWIFAHNHGFDARIVGFFREMGLGRYSLVPPASVKRRGAYKQPLMVIDNSPFLMRLFREDGQVLMLADTMNWLDCSLSKVGDMLGFAKGEYPGNDASDAVLAEYCRRDVEVTDLALRRIWGFCRDLGVKHWQATIASQAFTIFRSRYAKKNIKMPEDVNDLALDRHAYYGGRLDCFRLGRIEGPIYQVDVNSMYPSLMRDGLFPVAIEEKCHDAEVKTAGAPPHPCQTTAEVWIDSSTEAWPVRTRDGTIYCRGKVRTILCGPELRRACETGCVVHTGRWVRYRMSRIFTSYVQDLWAVRMAARARGDKLGDRLAKMLLDSLYGKFGQRQGEWVTLGLDYPQDHYGQGIVATATRETDVGWRIVAGVYQRRLRDVLADHAFVPIAAYVTSYGRVFMDAVRSKLWADGIYYQATDSLLIDEENLAMLVEAGLYSETELGKFRIDGAYTWVDIRNIQHIERPTDPIRQGLPSVAKPLGADVFESERWDGPWTGISRGNLSSVSIRTTLTRLRGTYSRQERLPNGHLRPWAIANWRTTPEDQRRLPLSTDRNQG